ncbi:class II aldolase/adducin family protein [Georgenia halophila]|uniref:Class II aldolase/adducin family protein n=1 Tax=Georgenia halophila TaxID=620889 RepID=A0ABP8LMA5_9MICO
MIGVEPTDELREELARLSRRSFERGLVPGVSGNNSIRRPGTDTMVIKTSGCCQGDMTAEDTVVMTFDGEVLDEDRRPSKEWQFHAAIYRSRPEVGAIAHLHPPLSVAYSVAGQIPPLVTAAARGHVREIAEVPLLPAGSKELADAVEGVMAGTEVRVVLMREHGTIAVGPDLDTAVHRTDYMEDNARVALAAGILTSRPPGDIELAHDPDPTAEGA